MGEDATPAGTKQEVESMALSEEQVQRAHQYFNVNGVVSDCPYCSTRGWDGGEIISAAVVDERGEV